VTAEAQRALTDQVVFVTGGTQGIGRAVAEAFADTGATVVVASRTAEPFDTAGGHRVHARRVDVGEEAECRAAVSAVQDQFGTLDVLVNNAGIAESVKFLGMDTQFWRRHQLINVEAPWWLIQSALPSMLEHGYGRVISVASAAAQIGVPYVAAYVAAKHALLGLTRSLAAEFARTNVTFNCVSPYFVDTPMAEATIQNIMAKTGQSRERAAANLVTPQGRLIQAEEVAAMCLHLATPAARSITGQSIGIDGGLTAV